MRWLGWYLVIMGKVRDKLADVQFHCDSCGHRWEGEPGRVVDVADKTHHPWDYFAECPECGAEAAQSKRQAQLLKMWANATGPRTAEGKQRSAANLDGHPTPEEARRTRFNAMKHGANAATATYFPAKPGKYPECDGCPYLDTCGVDGNFACQRKTELFMVHEIAFESQDPRMLQGLRAKMHAAVTAILDMIMQSIIARGVELESPQWYYDRDGVFHLAEYTDDYGQRRLLMEVRENPLLKRMSDIIRSTGMTLSDAGMTMAVQQERDEISGHLDGDKADRETMLEYQRQQAAALSNMSALIERASERSKRDPVALEYQQNAD